VTNDCRTSSEFPCKFEVEHLDDRLNLRFWPCGVNCTHPNGLANGCHAECLAWMSIRPDASFFEATRYSFEPPLSQQRIRYNKIIKTLCQRLATERLPMEIWWMIAKLLARESAVTTIEQVWEFRKRSDYQRNCNIVLTSSVWACFVMIEGIHYIAGLSNVARPGFRKIYSIENDKAPVHTVCVAGDHLGIRRLIFDCSDRSVDLPTSNDVKPGVWWRSIPVAKEQLTAKFDVSDCSSRTGTH